MSNIKYITGDATQPIGDGNKIIAHICNDVGAWGAGFVLAISKRWPGPEAHYRGLPGPLTLGMIQMVPVTPHYNVAEDTRLWVANMIAQHGIRRTALHPPIRYEALHDCLALLKLEAQTACASVHMPRIGCGLAGGTWDKIEPLIQDTLAGIEVFVYDLPRFYRRVT